MARIEIVNEQEQLEIVYFKIPECVTRFWQTSLIRNLRDETILKVKRDNPEEKAIDFLFLRLNSG